MTDVDWSRGSPYSTWLQFTPIDDAQWLTVLRSLQCIVIGPNVGEVVVTELQRGFHQLAGQLLSMASQAPDRGGYIRITCAPERDGRDRYGIRSRQARDRNVVDIVGDTSIGCLYGVFRFLSEIQQRPLSDLKALEDGPSVGLRMLDHWDNLDGTVERGYAGYSLFFRDHKVSYSRQRITDYARMLASIGINAIGINNVNVHEAEAHLLTRRHLPQLRDLAAIFREYGIRLYLSVHYASPMILGGLSTADPRDTAVRLWWKNATAEVYSYIGDLGGFVVKADSEFRPGPFTYGRGHVEGAAPLAEALQPYHGHLIWRCFVYNAEQDWRDRSTDRARAAYDHFAALDGQFSENVILQVKNGPMDFQVREPVSPLLMALESTALNLELQVTQEYTGQQKDLCYLLPQWKEILNFSTESRGALASLSDRLMARAGSGIVGVANVGDDPDWTGHPLAQANLYAFGRLAWNPKLSIEEVTREWTTLTLGNDPTIHAVVTDLLMKSWPTFEAYTAPLGVGWMVNPGHHYGPNVDGYEYSHWGTYHYADHEGVGVDRTVSSGTGYTAQYQKPWNAQYESLTDCPEELLLFFHHVPYTHQLRSGKTVIQHIYDSHFDALTAVDEMMAAWNTLHPLVNGAFFERVQKRLMQQKVNAKEWCDVVTTYFWRKSGIADEKQRVFA